MQELEAISGADSLPPACNTGGEVRNSVGYEVTGSGVDDVTVVFNLDGSRSLGRLQTLSEDGRHVAGGIILDYAGAFGRRESVFKPHFVKWMPSTNRLYVQLKKLGGEYGLLPLDGLTAAVNSFALNHLAERGIYSYESPVVSRIDVAVDLTFGERAQGLKLLEALHLARYRDGLRGSLYESTTVYIRRGKARRSDGRAYCRGSLHPELGKPGEVIRLEREKHWKDHAERPTVESLDPIRLRELWGEVFMTTDSGKLLSVPGEALTMTILERVRSGEMGAAQGERLRMFLELERLGVSKDYYSSAQLRDRRAEARKLGLTVDDALVQSIDVALGEILARGNAGL